MGETDRQTNSETPKERVERARHTEKDAHERTKHGQVEVNERM